MTFSSNTLRFDYIFITYANKVSIARSWSHWVHSQIFPGRFGSGCIVTGLSVVIRVSVIVVGAFVVDAGAFVVVVWSSVVVCDSVDYK